MCAIFGLIDYGKYFTAKQREKILKVLSKEAEVRGTDATGFAYNNGDNISIFKRPLPAHKLKLRLPEEANIILGHTRFATQGSEKNNANNHPFAGNAGNTRFALSHNGVLYNDRLLRIEKNIPKPYIEKVYFFGHRKNFVLNVRKIQLCTFCICPQMLTH